MTKYEIELCDCLSHVLLGTVAKPEISDFSELLRLARHHTVSPLLADLPKESLQGMSYSLRMQLIKDTMALERFHLFMNDAIADIASEMEKDGITYFLLKGQNCAARYPRPQRRQIGDIDLYVAPQNFESAVAKFKAKGFSAVEETMVHLTFRKGKNLILELHHDLQRLQWPRHDRALRRLCNEASHNERITLADTEVSVLPQELDIVVLCVHTMSHLYCAGLGLRHVCDYLMRVKWALDRNLDIEQLERMLRETGAYKIYCVLNYICNQYLHANLSLPVDKRNGERVLRWMMKSGNFSHGVDMGTGVAQFVRYYAQFLWHCIEFLPVSPWESLSWPVMKLKRAVKDEAHRKVDANHKHN